MLKCFSLVFALVLSSCASTKKEKKLIAWEAWENRSIEEVKQHPYFKLLPVNKVKHKDGPETWIFVDQSRYQTDAYCDSLGGCIGIPTYNCNNAFSVKDGIILGFEQSGNCPSLKTVKPQKK